MPNELRTRVTRGSSKYNRKFVDMDYVKSKFDARIDRTKKNLTELVQRQIRREIRRHRFIKDLIKSPIGIGKGDIQASFGLTQEKAEEAANKIIDILSESCSVQIEAGQPSSVAGKPSLSYKIFANLFVGYEDKFNDEPFRYSSERKKKDGSAIDGPQHEVPWMKWVLNAKQPPGIKEYGIAFNVPADILATYSRSGRALMIKKESRLAVKYGAVNYALPYQANPRGNAKNFVEEISQDKAFKKKLDGYVKNATDRVMKPRRL